MESFPSFHFDLALHPTKDTIKLITSLLEKVISVNDALQTDSSSSTIEQSDRRRLSSSNIYTCFHARSVPSISIHAYLTRILKYCPCANECFLAILVYFDRMAKPHPPSRTMPLRIDSYNVHRLIIAGVMIASKLFSDVFFTNTRYAKVGGLPVSELNVLEVEFLALNEYNLFVSVEEFQYYGDQLLIHWKKEHEGTSNMMNGDQWNDNTNVSNNNDMMDTQMTSTNHEYAQINRAARQLSIDKTSRQDIPEKHSDTIHTTPMKDLNRKSDEIDRHRLFKRPSSRAIGNTHASSSFTHNDNASSFIDKPCLPTPPGASPSTTPSTR
ncbi:cyclin-domain-containing protein [Halteromyces radiatus]|uniref:cyclin-domain-containing protein n=1 Tax=Halteromyces radiatus TaxID=101107 RepID=UPI00221FE3F7|nr:cyclin-domain-containing protein [Halteromyces radiatus]KAI8093889.1 cyclin-domain-containing protein [Halteromyces radiatus]